MGEGHRQRLFAKYSRGGIRSLCEEEIIELLLFLAIPRKDTRPIAAALIEKFGNLVGVLEAPRKEFENIDGIGEHASLILSFINDLLFYYRKDKRKYFKKQTYTDDIGEYLADTYGNETVEYVFAIYIDDKNRYRACDVLSTGQPFSAQLDFVYIEKRARQHGVKRVIIAHNHPSGLAIPSHSDIVATQIARSYLESMGIELIDHIIFERDDFISLAESDMLFGDEALEEFFNDWTEKNEKEKAEREKNGKKTKK